MDFVRKEQTAYLTVLLTRERLRVMMKGRNDYAVVTMFLFVVATTDRSLEFAKRCELIGMSFLYNEMADNISFDHRARPWMKSK